MNRFTLPVSLLLLLGVAPLASAQETLPPPEPPPPLVLPGPEEEPVIPRPPTGEVEPEITIREDGENVIEEYRVGGQLYMVRIIPTNGPPYYLIDTNGDGRLETFSTGLEDPNIVQWRLFSW